MGLRDQNNGKKIGISGPRIYHVTTLMYRYQYNQYNTIKIVGIQQVAETEPPEDTPPICLKLYSHALEQIPQIRISTSHTRFRQNQLRPADRILLFVNLSGDYLKRSHIGNKSD